MRDHLPLLAKPNTPMNIQLNIDRSRRLKLWFTGFVIAVHIGIYWAQCQSSEPFSPLRISLSDDGTTGVVTGPAPLVRKFYDDWQEHCWPNYRKENFHLRDKVDRTGTRLAFGVDGAFWRKAFFHAVDQYLSRERVR